MGVFSKLVNLFKSKDLFYNFYNPVLSKSIVENSLAISILYKYVYCRIYKSANSTVVGSLYKAETGIRIDGIEEIQSVKDNYFTKPSDLSKSDISNLKSFTKFSFVRDPYSRIWSAYLDKILPVDRPQRKVVLKQLGKAQDYDISFGEFLFFLENGGLRLNGHWAPQCDFLVLPINEYDFIGKVEKINNDLPVILQRIYGSEQEVVNINEHKTKASVVAVSMKQEEKMRVYKLYESDFDYFKYAKQF